MRPPRRRVKRAVTAAPLALPRPLLEVLESRVLLTADDQISEAILVSVPGSVSATISTESDVDMYRVAVNAAQTIAFDIDLPGSDLDSYIRLFNGAGTELAFSDDTPGPGEAAGAGSYIEHTFATAGTYYLGVSAFGNGGYNAVNGTNQVPGNSSGDYSLLVTANLAPTIGSLSDSPDPATAPATVTLTANSVADADGTIANVQFFRETNGTAGLQVGSDLVISTDTSGPFTATIDTSDMPAGTYSYYARARDNFGTASNVVSTTNTLQVLNNASISGTVWNDADADGVFDASEATLSGWTVFLDQNRNQVRDAGETFTTSGAGGAYTFGGLPGAATYYVTTQIPAGWEQTFPGAGGQSGAMISAKSSSTSSTVVAKSVPAMTTTGSQAPVYPIKSTSDQPIGYKAPRDAEGSPLIRLTNFQSDPRFNTIRGQNFAVAVLDTGVDLDHPVFGPDSNGDGVADRIVYQHDFADNDNDASDSNGHGTNVASVVASQDPTHGGMAPNVNLIALKVFPTSGVGSFAAVEAALQWVVAHAAEYNIASINMSIGDSGNYNSDVALYGMGDELAQLAAMNVIVVSAAGNSFFAKASVPGVAYPAADPNSLAVSAVYDANVGPRNWGDGASDLSTAPDRVASFSQRSAATTDIFAPGPFTTGGGLGGGSLTQGGTSQASPHIAGIAALAQQLAMRDLGRRLSMAEFKSLLNASGVVINDGDDEHDNVTNTGANFRRVDVLALGEAIRDMGVSPHTHTVHLSHAEAATNINFGNQSTGGSISGAAFDDYDGDHTFEAGEPGRAGVTIYIDADRDETLSPGDPTAVTDAAGAYAFAGLEPGEHRLRQVVPAGFIGVIEECVVNVNGDEWTQVNFDESRVVHTGSSGNDVYLVRRDVTGTRIEVVDGDVTWGQEIDTLELLAPGGIVINAGDGSDTLNVNATPPVPVTFNGGLNPTYTDTLNVNGGTYTFNSDAISGTANLQVNVNLGFTSTSVVFNTTQHLAGLAIGSGAVALMPANGNRYLFTKGLSIHANGRLDLTDNDLLWDYTGASPYTQARQFVLNGRNNANSYGGIAFERGAGDVVLAPVDNALFLKSSWLGQTIDTSTIIGKYTYYGDSNLDGAVTGDDYLSVDSNLGINPGTRQWFHGDFNFDGSVTGDDYLAIDANLGDGTLNPLAWADAQAEMTALHATTTSGGETYVQAVELAAKGNFELAWAKLKKLARKTTSRR